jgi:hypothetical protein
MTSTTLTTISGMVAAIGISIASYLATANMDGGSMKQPLFWIGLVTAAALGLKGYYTQGIPPAGQVVATKPAPPTA